MEAKAACPQCKQVMDTEVTFVLPSAMPKVTSSSPCGAAGDETGGYVKGLVTYMVTGRLEAGTWEEKNLNSWANGRAPTRCSTGSASASPPSPSRTSRRVGSR
ncbi:hypothetical protein D1007_59211 [Hordeum vulgare]|nr:hypothetical protein D1007_59211 [Hordeum vulgare]